MAGATAVWSPFERDPTGFFLGHLRPFGKQQFTLVRRQFLAQDPMQMPAGSASDRVAHRIVLAPRMVGVPRKTRGVVESAHEGGSKREVVDEHPGATAFEQQ